MRRSSTRRSRRQRKCTGHAPTRELDDARCFRMPESMDFVTGAGMVTIYNTAYVAVVIRGQVKPGETVLVTGASGGVGLATVQIARAKGARVLAGVTSQEKGQIA